MSPFVMTAWILSAVLVPIALALAIRKPRPDDIYTEIARRRWPRDGIDEANDELTRQASKRAVGKHPALAAPYSDFRKQQRSEESKIAFGKRKPGVFARTHIGTMAAPVRKPTISLTPRMIERVNIQRRLRGQPTLNRAGIKNAVAHAWDQPRRQPDTTSDWLTYLIVYEVLFGGHQSPNVGSVGGFTIDPNEPYNGQGGEFAGAGASGSWTDAPSSVTTAVALVSRDIDSMPPDIGNDKYAPGDTVGGYTPDPAPSYSAPDPSLSGGGGDG